MSERQQCYFCNRPRKVDDLESIPVPKLHKYYGLGMYVLACRECAEAEKKKAKKRGS